MSMFAKIFIPVALAGLVFVNQPVFAEETAAQPEQGNVAAVLSVETVDPGQVQEAAAPAGTEETSGGPGTATDEPGSADKSAGMEMQPDVTQPGMMGPGMPGCRMGKGGMMGMMPGVMGRGGMMGSGMGKGCKTGCAMGGCTGITREQYRELMGRLDVLDARMAKIDAMLERLLKR
jgi:hypothetical protein